ncbi:hypothetical protein D3C77_792040 [compost metagenome]
MRLDLVHAGEAFEQRCEIHLGDGVGVAAGQPVMGVDIAVLMLMLVLVMLVGIRGIAEQLDY